MLTFDTKNRWYAPGGLAIFLLQISLFIYALPPFSYGTWYQVEPTVLMVWVLAACNGAWLALGFCKGWLTLHRPLHPFLLCLLAWVGWQYIATACASVPWRSWFGHPAIGEGAGYYTALLLSYLLASVVWQRHRYRNIILAVASFDLLAFSWYYFNPDIFHGAGGWDKGKWASHLAFMVGYLWIAFMAAPRVRTRVRYAAMVAASMFILIWIARNKTAQYLLEPVIIGGSGILWLRLVFRPAWMVPGRFWRLLAVGGCLLPLTWVALSQSPGWVASANGSLPTRALFNQVSVSTVAHEPLRLWIGDGWGRYEDDLFKYALVDGVYAFHDGEHAPNWEMVDGHAFHAHDEAMEVLLALGLPGLLLWLALPVILVRFMPSRLFWWCAPMLLAVTALQSFWFILPHTLAYQALAFAALTPPLRGMPGATSFPSRWLSLGCALIAIVMTWTGYAQWQAMRYGETLSHAVTEDPATSYDGQWLAEDFVRGGDRFHTAAEFYSQWVGQRTVAGTVTARDVDWYLLLMQAAHRAAQLPQSGAYLASSEMRLLNLLYMNTAASPLDALKAQAKEMFPEAAIALAAKAPLREDVTAPFLYNLAGFTGNNEVQAVDILSHILALAPDHRAALWAMGQILIKNPASARDGHDMLQRAADLGVQRVYPLTLQDMGTFAPTAY